MTGRVDPFSHLRAAENHRRAVNRCLSDLSDACAFVEVAERKIADLIDHAETLGVTHDEIRRAAAMGSARVVPVTREVA